MGARHLIGLVLTPLALAIPANAGAVTCDGRTSTDHGVPQVLTRCGHTAVGPIAQALGTTSADLDRIGSPVDTASGRVVRLQQSVAGVPVLGGQVALAYDRAGSLDMVQSSAIADPGLDPTPTVSAAAAKAVAGLGDDADAELVVDPNDGAPILAWRLERATLTPSADLVAIVDARTGALVRRWNAVQDGTATAPSSVFDPNPVQESGNTSLADGNDLTDVPAADYVGVTLDHLDNTSSLSGDFADVTFPLTAPPGIFNRTDLQSRFEANNAYYAITEAQKKIQALGFPNFFDAPTPLLVNADAQDNSNYNPATQAITYGFGGVDDAEDAEIVLHEYGHAIQDHQVPGFGAGDEQGAMGEGFGDFLAGMYYLDKGNSAYESSHRRYCIGEWDATTYNPVDPANPGSGCLRWIDGTDETDGTDIGAYSGTPDEVHDDGRFWSAGMTCIFKGLGGDLAARDKALRLVIDSQTRLVPIDDNTAFEAQIESMITSDQNLYGGDDVELIRNCAAQRGLATLAETAPPDTTPPTVEPVVSPAAPDGKHGFYVQTVSVSWNVADGDSAVTSTGCDPVTISNDTPLAGATLTCTATSSGGMTSKSVTIRRQAKAPNTKITRHPPKRTSARRARFAFKARLDGARFKCSLDGKHFKRCRSPKSVHVGPGPHTFKVRAKSRAGKKERKPASFRWTVG